MHSFYLAPEEWGELGKRPEQPGQSLLLQGGEFTHLAKVLRMRPGDELELLDGCGRSGRFCLRALQKKAAELEALEITLHPRPGGHTLAMGYNKGLRRSWLLEKAVELEAGGLWFWQAERSQGKMPNAQTDPEAVEGWKGQLIAGAKQCKNPWLPELRTLPGGAAELAATRQNFNTAYVLWEEAEHSQMLSPEMLRQENCLFVLGPEGGISQAEMKIFTEAGFQPLSLGERILRWETAALLCLGLAWWGKELARFKP